MSLLLLTCLAATSCSSTQVLGWAPVNKPWEQSAIAKAAMVRATTTTGREVTLTRAAIVEEEGRTDLVGHSWEPRAESDETERLDLATITQLEMRPVGPSSFTMSRTQVMALLTIAVLVLLLG